MSLTLEKFIELLLEKGQLNKDLKEKSKQVEEMPGLTEILINFSGNQAFTTILKTKKYGEISLAKGDIVQHVILNYSIDKDWIKDSSYEFLDKLTEAAENKISDRSENKEEFKKIKKEQIIGIDLGTTYSVASILEGTKPVPITSSDGSRLFPSVVSIEKDGSYLVGAIAKRKIIAEPLNTFYSTKRFIGRRSVNINETEKNMYDYQIDLNSEKVKLRCPRKSKPIDCEEISSQILMLIKENAENVTNKVIKKCVITVPAYFDDNQRSATKAAAEIAGMKVLRLIAEPTAAAYAFGCDKMSSNENILVADIGGGTFDISLVNFQDKTLTSVIATSGSTLIGGDDFTECLQNMIREDIIANHKDFYEDITTKITLREEAEKVKCALSEQETYDLVLPPLITSNKELIRHKFKISRKEFYEASKDVFLQINDLVKEFLKEEKVVNKSIDKLVLAGGASRMPKFRQMLEGLVGLNASLDLNPDEVVANGAVLCAELATGYQPQASIIDVTPLSLGIEILGDIFSIIIPKNTSLPTEKKSIYTTIEDNQPCVNFRVFQGERKVASANTELGNFLLEDIEEGEAGEPQLETTFRIDLDGILTASARDLATDSYKEIKIKNSTVMKKSEIKRLQKEALKNKQEDLEKVEDSNNLNILRTEFKELLECIKDKNINIDNKFSRDEVKTFNKAKECLDSGFNSDLDSYILVANIRKIIKKYC